jgi:hypothetical protein
MERTMLSFNLPNWITVMLMALIGYAVVGLARQAFMHASGSGGPPTSQLGGY